MRRILIAGAAEWRILGCLLLAAFSLPAYGQAIRGGHPDGSIQKRFTAPADQLDEFLDRFNNQDPMFAEAFPNRPKRASWSERAFLIKTLVNTRAKVDAKVVDAFSKQVSHPDHEQLISLADTGVYASLTCSVWLDAKIVKARLVFYFEQDTTAGFTAWRLYGAAFPGMAPATLAALPPAPPLDSARPRMGLAPSSHGNGFISLHRALTSGGHFSDNLATPATPAARQLAALVDAGRLKLERVTYISYHFLDIDNYLFTVNDVSGPEGTPNGYLIGKLIPAGPQVKAAWHRRLLSGE